MRIGERNYNIKAGLSIFFAISVISAIVILYLDVDKNTWAGIKQIKLQYGLLAGALMITHWILNGFRFKILVNGLDENVKFWDSFKAFMGNMFMSAMTPSQSGGGPLQIYMLNRAGIPLAKAFSGCLMGAVLTVITLATSTMAIILFVPDLKVEFGHNVGTVFGVVFIIFIFSSALFILSIIKIRTIKRMTGRFTLFMSAVIKSKKGMSITRRVMRGLDQYSKCMSIFARAKKGTLVIAGILNVSSLSALAIMAPVLLKGLNVPHNVFRVFLTQFILYFIAYFSPTPGASGVAEFTNYWMLTSLNIEQSMLGVYTLLWRFFTSFIAVGVGGIIVLSLFRKNKR